MLTVVTWVGALAAGLGGIVYLGRVLISVASATRRLVHLVDDLIGEPARGDQPARLGVLAQLASIEARVSRVEAELSPNGGRSVKDQVTALAAAATARS